MLLQLTDKNKKDKSFSLSFLFSGERKYINKKMYYIEKINYWKKYNGKIMVQNNGKNKKSEILKSCPKK